MSTFHWRLSRWPLRRALTKKVVATALALAAFACNAVVVERVEPEDCCPGVELGEQRDDDSCLVDFEGEWPETCVASATPAGCALECAGGKS